MDTASAAFVLRRQLLQLSLYRIGRLVSGNTHTVSMFCYHSFSEDGNRYSIPYDVFKEQIEAIRRVADIIPFAEALEALETKRRRRSAVVITIDDGYEDVMQLASYTEKEQIPVTLFALSDPDHADRATMDHTGSLVRFSDLRYLASKGFTIGCHSGTHVNLTKVSPTKLQDEVRDAKETLEAKVGVPVEYFAYPNGQFSNAVIKVVKEAGYKAACSILPGVITPQTNRWVLPRTVINREDTVVQDPALYVSGPAFIGNLIDRIGLWER